MSAPQSSGRQMTSAEQDTPGSGTFMSSGFMGWEACVLPVLSWHVTSQNPVMSEWPKPVPGHNSFRQLLRLEAISVSPVACFIASP